MRLQFWLAGALFHLGVVASSVHIVAKWSRRLVARRPWPVTIRAAARDAALFLTATLVLAGAASLIGPRSGFTALRFLSQALFGETVVLLAVLAGLHARRGFVTGAWVAGLGAVLLLAAYAEAYHRGPADLRVSVHEICVDERSEGRERLRILHLSDIQTDSVGAHEDRAIRQALALAPDLIVLTGDYVHPRLGGDRARIAADLRALLARRSFRAPLGVYAVRGDVDRDWPEVLERTGITLLSGELARVELPGGRALTLIGLTPGMSRGRDAAALWSLVRSAPPGDLHIALGHSPDYVRVLARHAPVDLALAGHTHGGQVVLPFFGPPYTKSVLPRRHASGLHDYGGVPLHVTRGVGMERGTAPQIRFLCPPEICLLQVQYRTARRSEVSVAEVDGRKPIREPSRTMNPSAETRGCARRLARPGG